MAWIDPWKSSADLYDVAEENIICGERIEREGSSELNSFKAKLDLYLNNWDTVGATHKSAFFREYLPVLIENSFAIGYKDGYLFMTGDKKISDRGMIYLKNATKEWVAQESNVIVKARLEKEPEYLKTQEEADAFLSSVKLEGYFSGTRAGILKHMKEYTKEQDGFISDTHNK